MSFFRRLSALFVAVLLLAILPMQVSAATIDGLDITFETDRSEYESHEDIVTTITVTNSGSSDVTNLRLENFVPEGYTLKDVASNILTLDSLAPGDSFQLKVELDSLTPAPDESPGIVRYVLYALVGLVAVGGIAIVVIVITKRSSKKKATQALSILLCIALLGSSVMSVSAQQEQAKLTLAHTIKVAGQDKVLNALLTYDGVLAESELISVDLGGALYSSESDIYYIVDAIPTLTGTLAIADNVFKAVCRVTDILGNELFCKEFNAANVWSINEFALIVGQNVIQFTLEFQDGTTYEKSITVNNANAENMETLDVDKGDTDEDGVLNFTEQMYNTDPEKADTDGDGLSDYYEMAVFGTDPNAADTNEDGVTDSAADADQDKLSNQDEIDIHGTDPISVDSDGDGLSDYEEITNTKTDPVKSDSDEDGKNDSWEIEHGYDPLTLNESFPEDEEEPPKAPSDYSVESEGEVVITVIENHEVINENTPGYIGSDPVHIEVAEGSTANVTVQYDPTKLEEGDTPGLYYFDEDTQCYEEIPSQIDENGNVTATVDKNGTYVLLNHRLMGDVWQNDILRPSELTDNAKIDMVFVIDRSNSMYDNDPNNLRKLVTKEFISKLRPDLDRAAIVQFTAVGEVVMPLSSDKDALFMAVDSIENSDGGGCAGSDNNAGTNGSAGLRQALNLLAESQAEHKYIVFLTDGADTHVAEDYGDAEGTTGITGEAKTNGIVIYTVGLVGNGEVDTDLLKRVAQGTNGQYYLATVGTDPENNSELVQIYENIESVTIDRHLDSNSDGISDYYTKMICDGKLKTGTGTSDLFGGATYETVQANADLDGDGLLNGQELVIVENDNGVFVKIVAYPYRSDSDNDTLSDLVEVNAGTSPMKKNGNVDVADASWLCNSENFMSDQYLDLYNDSALERGSVFIGNAFFGTTLDQTTLYRKMLCDYFYALDEDLVNESKASYYRNLVKAYKDEALNLLAEGLLGANSSNTLELASKLTAFKDFCKKITDYAEVVTAGSDVAEEAKLNSLTIEKLVTQLVNSVDNWNLKQTEDTVEQIKKAMDRICELSTPAIQKQSNEYLNLLTGYLLEAQEKSGELSKKIEIRSSKIAKLSKGLDFLDKATMVIEWGTESWDAYLNYCDTLAALDVIMENVYILDCIIATSDNLYLTSAARDIRFYINESYSEQTRELKMKLDQAESVVTGAVMDVVHEVIGASGVPGAIIELARTIGNVVFNLDEISQAAAETVALSCSAEVLAINYLAHLEGGYAVLYDISWIGYADYSSQMYNCILNLSELRKRAEEKMAQWQDDQTIVDSCNTNAQACLDLINKYNERYYAFYRS